MAAHNIPKYRQGKVWTPTLTIVTAIDTLTFLRAWYSVTGKVVQCSVAAEVTPPGTALWEFRVSLPPGFGIQVADPEDIIGVCGPSQAAGFGGAVTGHAATNQAIFDGAHSALLRTVVGQFSYVLTT